MENMQQIAPSKTSLWNGAVLSTIAHALWVAQNPTLSYAISWKRSNYNLNDSQGTIGTITFSANGVVGVFRDDKSKRVPWRSTEPYQLQSFLEGIPPDLLTLAQEQTLKFVFDEWKDYKGPIISAAFWSEGESLISSDTWIDMLSNGGYLIRRQLLDTRRAVVEWVENYQLSKAQAIILEKLYFQRIQATSNSITVEDDDRKIFTLKGGKGIKKSQELLDAIGILLP